MIAESDKKGRKNEYSFQFSKEKTYMWMVPYLKLIIRVKFFCKRGLFQISLIFKEVEGAVCYFHVLHL